MATSIRRKMVYAAGITILGFAAVTLAVYKTTGAVRGRAPRGGESTPEDSRPPSKSTGGTADGTGAPTSTTGRRSDPPSTRSAGSIRSPNRGE